MRTRTGALLLLSAVLLAGCHDEDAPETTNGLESYTDAGDGCAQVVSAIGYADELLRPLGQERFQDFDNAVRSRLASVAGTVRTEAEDWPSLRVETVASDVAVLAVAASRIESTPEGELERQRSLLKYRTEAARLVLTCLDEAVDAGSSD
ncbi:MAG: hypothetical protein F2825_03860 [Actinobacteria bacterium]|uniref:Unannotated protein n=1 Tax=freshwater metagenome TaxID=449393 RepID=A0A6J7GX39_9ZZZZ|nr:hypothetical protein [Actinomycetota bacterium]